MVAVGLWYGQAYVKVNESSNIAQPGSGGGHYPQYSKTVHFRVAFYCGQPKAHLCNNHAV